MKYKKQKDQENHPVETSIIILTHRIQINSKNSCIKFYRKRNQMNEDSALKELLNAMMKCLQLAKADGHKYTVLLFGNQELYCKKYDLQYTDKITFSSEEERTEFVLDIQCDNFIAIYDLTEDLPKQLDIGSLRV